jgi:hypothetical protein
MNDDDRLIEQVSSEEQDNEMSLRPYEILTYPADFTLEVLVSKWEKGEIRSPPLQRRFVWSQIRASKLIESFLMGLPVPPVFFYQDRQDSGLLIVDGHQRLRSIMYFFSGWFGDRESEQEVVPFNLVGLNERSPFSNATFQTLEETDQSAINRLKNSVLRAFVMKQLEPDDDTSIFQVFERLNTGGMILQGQEIRNCIYEGKFNDLLKKLNKGNAWRQIIGKKSEDKRMRDVELILRFFSLFYSVSHYEKPMKGFMNNFMRTHRHPSKEKEKEFEDLFTQTAETVVQYLGPRPFHILRGLNAAVYDSAFTAFARHLSKIGNENVSAAKINQVRSKFQSLLENRQYKQWVSSATTDKDVVPNRLKKAEQILFG